MIHTNESLHRPHALVLGLWVLVLCGLPSVLGAQTTCVPVAQGVPALNGPPIWWDADGDTSFPEIPQEDNRLTDPRWRGNAAITYPGVGASGDEVVFRSLQRSEAGGTFIYLSWWVKVAPSFDNLGANRVLVGFDPGGGADDVLLQIELTSATAAMASTSYSPTVWTKAAADSEWGSPLLSVPNWLTDFTRVWVDPSGVMGVPNQWAVQMRVPVTSSSDLDDGVQIDPPGSDFHMWYEVRVDLAGPTDMTGVVFYNWPRMVQTSMMGFDTVYPPTTLWGPFRLASSPVDPGCGTDCVSIARLDVGTDNTTTHQIDLSGPNTFFALPTNNSGSNIPAGSIQADFRIANWGSMPDWNAVPNQNSLWELIPDDGDAGNIPNGQDAPSTGVINDGSKANAGNRIETNWTLTAAQRAPFLSNDKRLHQCMLVELQGPGLRFCPQSVYRNMDFVDASLFQRTAELSIRGISPVPSIGPERDVFLYVETLNMPEQVKPGGGEVDNAGGTVPRVENEFGATDVRRLTPDQLDAFMPTYRVHVYHDTGSRLQMDGEDCKVLKPQGSFGYYVSHEGELEGWRHSLDGPSLEQLAPNFYKIPVREGGAVLIDTEIEALEPGRGMGGAGTSGRWSFSIHLGWNEPVGDAGDFFGQGPAAGLDFEYLLTSDWAFELFAGWDQFDGPGDFEPDVTHLSLNAKRYVPVASDVNWFFGLGFGTYDFSPGGSEDGFNACTGAQFNLRPEWALEATLKYHSVSSGDFEFLELLGGFRYRF